MKKMFILVLVLVFALSALSGCSKTEISVDDPNVLPSEESGEVSPSEEQPSEKIVSGATYAEGTYNGQIDNNSIEISMSPEDAPAFRTTEVLDQLAGLNPGDKVRFSYETNAEGQLVLTRIGKLD